MVYVHVYAFVVPPRGGGDRTHVSVCVRDVPSGGGKGRMCVNALTSSPVIGGEDTCIDVYAFVDHLVVREKRTHVSV